MKLPNSEDLNEEQEKIYWASLKKDLLVMGPPGTGKTVMALYRAQMISRKSQNNKFWVLMYNKLLRQYTENNLDIGAFANGDKVSQRIRTMHSWVYSWGRNWGWGCPELERYVYDWDEAIRRLLNKEPHIQKRATNWDHIIIDEGQDFAPGFYKTLQMVKMLGESHGKKMSLTVFADENQQLEEVSNSSLHQISDEIKYSNGAITSLTLNYRNSRQIAELSNNFYVGASSGKPKLPDRAGPTSPRLMAYCSHRDEIAGIANFAQMNEDLTVGVIIGNDNTTRERVYNLLRNMLTASQIGVQTYHHKMTKEELGEIQLEKAGEITVVNGASCKGLEFDAVFIPALEKYSPVPGQETVFKMNMYVRISRARDYLFLSYVSSDGQNPRILNYLPNEIIEQREYIEASVGGAEEPPETTVETDDQPDPVLSDEAEMHVNGFTISKYKKAILVKGDTRPIKEEIKSMGGRWFRRDSCWMFGGKRLNEVIDFLKEQA